MRTFSPCFNSGTTFPSCYVEIVVTAGLTPEIPSSANANAIADSIARFIKEMAYRSGAYITHRS